MKSIQCKFCQADGFHWKQLPNEKWRLHNDEGVVHSCETYKALDKPITLDILKARAIAMNYGASSSSSSSSDWAEDACDWEQSLDQGYEP